jgi:hypothetical protein
MEKLTNTRKTSNLRELSNLDELLASSDKLQNFGAVEGKGKMQPCTGTEALYGPYGPWGGGVRGIALPFHDHGTKGGEGSASRPGRSVPPGKTWYPL